MARRQWLLREAWRSLAKDWPWAGWLAALLFLSATLAGWPFPFFAVFLLWAVTGVMATGVRCVMGCPSDLAICAWLDRACDTRDRLVTLHGLLRKEPDSAIARAARDECASALDPAGHKLPTWRESTAAPWGNFFPLLGLLLVFMLAGFLTRPPPEPSMVEASPAMQQTAESLTRVEQELARLAEPDDPALEKLLEEIRRAADQLQSPVATPEEAEKALLREMARAEDALRELASGEPGLSPEERSALQQAAEQAGFDEAAAHLAHGRDEDALDDLLGSTGRMDEEMAAAWEAFQEALRQAMADAGLDNLAGGAMQGLSQAAPSDPQNLREALQQMKEALERGELRQQTARRNVRDLEEQRRRQQGGDQLAGDSDGDPVAGRDDAPSEGEGEGAGEWAAASFPAPMDSPGTEDLEAGLPGGPAETAGRQEQLSTPEWADGETLYRLLASGADEAEAGTAYRELFEATEPARLQAMETEEIPPGSRLYIRRYFELIRP